MADSNVSSPPGSRISNPPAELADQVTARLLEQNSSERQRRALSVFSVAAAAVIVWVVMPVGIGILLGTLTAFAVQPLYERIVRRTRRPKLAAAGCVLVVGLGISGATTGVIYLLVVRGVVMAQALRSSLGPDGEARAFILSLASRYAFLQVRFEDITAKLRDAAAELASRAAVIAGLLATAAFSGLLTLFFVVMTTYFILRNWNVLTRHAEDLFPLKPRHTHALFEEFRKVGRTTLMGTVVTGVAQGVLAAIGYELVGVPEAAFFGAATATASLLPGVGTMLVWVPAGIYLFATGHPAGGVIELVYGGLVVVGVSDYVLRPKLVGGHGQMPALLTFASLFGGVEVFGLIGLILGPLLVSIAVALLRIYVRETAELKADIARQATAPSVSRGDTA